MITEGKNEGENGKKPTKTVKIKTQDKNLDENHVFKREREREREKKDSGNLKKKDVISKCFFFYDNVELGHDE